MIVFVRRRHRSLIFHFHVVIQKTLTCTASSDAVCTANTQSCLTHEFVCVCVCVCVCETLFSLVEILLNCDGSFSFSALREEATTENPLALNI